jgi:hypothetical protein
MSINIGRFSETSALTADKPPDVTGKGQKPPELVYRSAEEFLHEQLLPTYVRDVDGRAATAPRESASGGKTTPITT